MRIGIVGYGGMGAAHAGYIVDGKVPDSQLTAVCDARRERLDEAKKTCGEGVALFDNCDDLLDASAVDGVLIATPHYDHPPLAIKAFEKGLHVLIEKPAGVYTRQVREMNEAAAASGKVFAIMFNQRTHAFYQKLRGMVDGGELGKITRTNWIITNWFRTQHYYDSGTWRATWTGEGGGVLLNQCPHNLDLWQWICGMPRAVRAFCGFGKYHDIEVEDDVTAYVEYEDGATGVFITSTGDAPGTNRLEITGDNGKAVLEDGKLTFTHTKIPVSQFCREHEAAFATPEIETKEIEAEGGGGGHDKITSNWVDAILNGTPLIAPGEEGIKSLELSNAMLLSAWTDSKIELPVDEDLFYEKLSALSRPIPRQREGKTYA